MHYYVLLCTLGMGTCLHTHPRASQAIKGPTRRNTGASAKPDPKPNHGAMNRKGSNQDHEDNRSLPKGKPI
ncbi:hypothetical protein F5X99DRAFT_373262 [Biscogniauxia marginata]|nr:hypothetical protein F5X99DRAFT_373262 [Biscogniauxia marginata]